MTESLSCTVGVMAFNEEANIRHNLESLLSQRLSTCRIREIFVVASGCTDNTVCVVQAMAKETEMIKLLIQERREGKASAINFFLRRAEGDIVVIESGDTIPEKDTVENLVKPFLDSEVGMTGAHPVPVNSTNSFMGFTAHLFWRLHHELALCHPKLGELIAFRNIVSEIPEDTAVDEASIEAIITKTGYRVHYAKDAVVHNKGPETVSDFLRQRRRIVAGHKHLESTQGYIVSTMRIGHLWRLLRNEIKETSKDVKSLFWLFGAIFLEMNGRLLGLYDYYAKKKNPFAWDIAKSTKDLKNGSTSS